MLAQYFRGNIVWTSNYIRKSFTWEKYSKCISIKIKRPNQQLNREKCLIRCRNKQSLPKTCSKKRKQINSSHFGLACSDSPQFGLAKEGRGTINGSRFLVVYGEKGEPRTQDAKMGESKL